MCVCVCACVEVECTWRTQQQKPCPLQNLQSENKIIQL